MKNPLSRIACAVALAAALAGCASPPAAPSLAQLPWQDARFEYDPALVTLSSADVFRLDPQLAALLADPDVQPLPPLPRARRLLTLIFGPDRDQFAYEAGHSTPAAQTWQKRRGDCISLTVLAYAAAKALRLDAEIHEVRVPALHVRRHGFEFVNHHVNLRIRIPALPGHQTRSELVVDFDPDAIPGQDGQPLDERAVLARLYSNLATERLTQGDRRGAYAWLKAALANDPAHAPSYTNLAVLYRGEGLHAEAERLLRSGIQLGTQPETAMQALHAMLLEQGRSDEARTVEAQLRTRQEADPYYWIGRGTHALMEGRAWDAVRSLERAQEMSNGFSEVHRQLAIAYWKTGKREQAREQLALLASSEQGTPTAAKLKRKLLQIP